MKSPRSRPVRAAARLAAILGSFGVPAGGGAIVFATVAAAERSSTMELGVRISGAASETSVGSRTNVTAAECAQACVATAACTHWSLARLGPGPLTSPPRGGCHLWRGAGPLRRAPNAIVIASGEIRGAASGAGAGPAEGSSAYDPPDPRGCMRPVQASKRESTGIWWSGYFENTCPGSRIRLTIRRCTRDWDGNRFVARCETKDWPLEVLHRGRVPIDSYQEEATIAKACSRARCN